MTQNTIDLATAALNLNSSSDTASPGNTGICAGKPPFGQSLEEAMQTTDVNSVTRWGDAEQLLPQAGKNCRHRAQIRLNLEPLASLKLGALADAISRLRERLIS